MSHTPGPWSLPHFAYPGLNCKCGYVLTDSLLGAVCTVHASGEGARWSHGDNPKFAEAVANAHLIAAAPELLEALIGLLEVEEGDLIGADFRHAINKAKRNARTAIAKATGVQP